MWLQEPAYDDSFPVLNAPGDDELEDFDRLQQNPGVVEMLLGLGAETAMSVATGKGGFH